MLKLAGKANDWELQESKVGSLSRSITLISSTLAKTGLLLI